MNKEFDDFANAFLLLVMVFFAVGITLLGNHLATALAWTAVVAFVWSILYRLQRNWKQAVREHEAA